MTRYSTKWAVPAAFLAVVAIGLPAPAQQRDARGQQQQQTRRQQPQQQPQQQQQQQQQQARQQPQRVQVKGEILRTKKVDLRRTDQQNLVVLLRTSGDRRIAADLGSLRNLRNVDVRSGDRVSVRGTLVRLGERPVIMARQFDIGGKTVDVSRRRPGPSLAKISGKITRTKDVQGPSGKTQCRLALIETAQGNRRLAHLGPVQKLDRAGIRQGDRATVFGHIVRVHGRPMLVAHRIESGGKTVQLSHQEMQQLARRPEVRRLTAEVVQTKQIQLPGGRKMLVALLETDRGRRTANLGSVEKLKGMDIRKGDRITLTGRIVSIHDHPVLMAHQIQAGGRTVELEHPRTTARAPQQGRQR